MANDVIVEIVEPAFNIVVTEVAGSFDLVAIGPQGPPGGGAGGGHTIADDTVTFPARSKLDFRGAGVVVSDESGTDSTVVTIAGGGSGGDHLDSDHADAFDALGAAAAVNTSLTTHKGSADHDARYYTQTQTNTLLNGKSSTGHAHTEADISDLGAYIEDAPSDGTKYGRLNAAWTPIVDGVTDHNALSNLTTGDPHTQYHNDTRGDARYYQKGEVDTALAGKSNTGHGHTLADVSDSGTAAGLNVPATGDAAVGEVVKGDDTRLSDARTPTSHSHPSTEINDSTATGRAVLTAADAAAARTAIGAGTSSFDGAYSSLSGTPTLGSAAGSNVDDFATGAEGDLATSSVQQDSTYTTAITKIMPLSQAQYDAIGTPSADTLYVVI